MRMKWCTGCGTEKELSDFNRQKSTKDGLQYQCRTCQAEYKREYRKNNKEKIAESHREYREANKEKIAETKREYREANKEKIAEYDRKYRENNRGKCNARTAKRRAAKLQATPNWLTEFDHDYIKSIYMQGEHLKMHVDHIIPLQGETVCGLHVPWNLQLLEPEENIRKSNKIINE